MGTNVKVKSKREGSSDITFEGKTPLVFGFQVWRLFYDKGEYTRQEPEKPRMMLGASRSTGAKLLTDRPFIRIG